MKRGSTDGSNSLGLIKRLNKHINRLSVKSLVDREIGIRTTLQRARTPMKGTKTEGSLITTAVFFTNSRLDISLSNTTFASEFMKTLLNVLKEPDSKASWNTEW